MDNQLLLDESWFFYVDICYDPANRKFISAGSSTYIRTGKIATYGVSYLKSHFVCSFRFPQNN
ncbi:MAG: hypothetical protein IKL07_09940 [Clostridium sp.]|nr:hypothetical protein [Clostridium sp.]